MRSWSTRRYECAHHLEAERSVDHEKNEVCGFANVDHGGKIIVTLDKGESPFFPADNCHGSSNVVECLLSISADEGLDEGALSNAWWANDGYYDRWWNIIRGTVHEGDMESSLILLCCTATLPLCSST